MVSRTLTMSRAAQAEISAFPQYSSNWSFTSASSANAAIIAGRSPLFVALTNARTAAGSAIGDIWTTLNGLL